jgi:large subunit ribosomal protein L25
MNAEPRTEFGKGAARRIRRAQKVPAVLYGHGTAPRHITLPGHDLMLALKTKNALLALTIEGKQELAIAKDVQRDPIKGFLEVALHVVGDVVPDALFVSELTVLEVLAEATNIPTGFDVDISGRPIGSQVLAKEVELPAGVELLTDPEHLVVNIVPAPTADQVESELAEAEAEVGIERAEPAAEAAEATEGDGAPQAAESAAE